MSQYDEFDRSLARWFDAEAHPAGTQDVLASALDATRRHRPRPSWLGIVGSHWVGDGAGPSGAATLGRTGVRTSMALVLLLLVLALVAGAVLVGAGLFQNPSPAELRRDGEVIVFERLGTGPGWDLAAQDPETGEVRKIVETDGIVDCPDKPGCVNFVRVAEWSPDGRRVAFQVSHASLDGPPLGPCSPTIGLWVTDALGELRQLTRPCDVPPAGPDEPIQEVWAWAPAGDRLAYARIDGTSDELFVIDATDGTRKSLGTAEGDLAKLSWSPDGTRVAYTDGGSVRAIEVDGGEGSRLADSFDDIVDLAWSPDGARIFVHDEGRERIQVMNADGSDLHAVLEGADACCSTAWSPAGDRILYMLSVVRPGEPAHGRFDTQVWTVAPDGSNRIEVFDSNGCVDANGFVGDGIPVWSPSGQIAYSDCGTWVVANADGTGQARPLGGASADSGGPPLRHRSWDGGGLTEWDHAMIGQIDH